MVVARVMCESRQMWERETARTREKESGERKRVMCVRMVMATEMRM